MLYLLITKIFIVYYILIFNFYKTLFIISAFCPSKVLANLKF